MNKNKVLCEIKWTIPDVKEAFREKYNREPTEEELQTCIDEIDWGLIEDTSISNGWTIINSAVSEVLPL